MKIDKKNEPGQFSAAYAPIFKFYQENHWYLTHYAKRICQVIKSRRINSMMSLGIGYRAVSSRIIEHVGLELDSYLILEGSVSIINDFLLANDLPPGVETLHTYFEEFETKQTFQAIEMGFVLEHVDDPGAIVRKFAHFLSNDGVMFIAVPNARSLHRLIGHHSGLLKDLYHLSEHDIQLGHKRYFDLESISQLVRDAGLKIIRSQGLMLKPITADQIEQLGWGEEIIQALMHIGDDYPEIANCILLEASK